jgi:hypothetical protein
MSMRRRHFALLLLVSTAPLPGCSESTPDRLVGTPAGIARQRDKGEPIELLNTEFGVYRSIDVPDGYFVTSSAVASPFLIVSNIDRPGAPIISVDTMTGKLATLDLPRGSDETDRTYFLAGHAVEIRDNDISIANLSDGVSAPLSGLSTIDQQTFDDSELHYDDEVIIVQGTPSDVVVPLADPMTAWVVGGQISAVEGNRVVAELEGGAFAELALVEGGAVVAQKSLDGYPSALSVNAGGVARALTADGTIIEWDFASDQPEQLIGALAEVPDVAYFVDHDRILTESNGAFQLVDVDGQVIADLTGRRFDGASGGCLELTGRVYDLQSGREIGYSKDLETTGACMYQSFSLPSVSRNLAIVDGRGFDVGSGVVLDIAPDGSAFISRDEQLEVTLTNVADGSVQRVGSGYGAHQFVG